MSNKFWMSIAFWLRLKITIVCNGNIARGYLLTSGNQFGDFLLHSHKEDWRGEMRMYEPVKCVERVSLFPNWRFKLREYVHCLWWERALKKRLPDYFVVSKRYSIMRATFSLIGDCIKLVQHKRFKLNGNYPFKGLRKALGLNL